MKTLILVLFFATPVFLHAKNIAYNPVTGDIKELDDANVDRFVDPNSAEYDASVTTGVYSGVDLTGPVRDYKVDAAGKTATEKSAADKKAVADKAKAAHIIELKLKLAALDALKLDETDPNILAQIDLDRASTQTSIDALAAPK